MKWKRILLAGVLVVPTALLTLLVSANGCYSRRVDKAFAAYAKAGEPIQPEDFPNPAAEALAAGVALTKLADVTITPEDRSRTNPRDFLSDGFVITPDQIAAARVELASHFPDEAALGAALAAPVAAWRNPQIQSFAIIDIPYLGKLRSLANALADDARIAILSGDTLANNARVIKRFFQIEKIAALAGDDGLLITALVSTGLDALARRIIEEGPVSLTAADARPIIAELLDDKARDERNRHAMQVERACALLSMDSSMMGLKPYLKPAFSIGWTRELPAYLAMSDIVSAGMREPSQPKREDLRRQYHEIANRNGVFFTRAIYSSEYSITMFARGRTERYITACIVALRAYRTEHNGSLPASLSELVPTYLPAVPLDPFSSAGEPLKLDPTRTYVYSAGINGLDENCNLFDPRKRSSVDAWALPDFAVLLVPQPPTTRPADDESSR